MDTSIITSRSKGVLSPIYRRVSSRLKGYVESERLNPGDFVGSEHKLCKEYNVSRVSVRKAVDTLVAEGLLERQAGKGLFVREKTNNGVFIQVVVSNLADDLIVQAIRGIQAEAVKSGTHINIYEAHRSFEDTIKVLSQLPESPFKGSIICNFYHEGIAELIYDLKKAKYPFVLFDGCMRDIKINSVRSDNYDGGYRVGKKLVELGHSRIAFVGPLKALTVYNRLTGLRDAVRDAGVAFDKSLVKDMDCDETQEDWSLETDRHTVEVMNEPHRPTAIVYSCDAVAVHGYQKLTSMGFRVPDDVSVVGFDDNPVAKMLHPALTTVRQDADEMGRTAYRLLMRQLTHGNGRPEDVVLPVEFIARKSVAPPRGDSWNTKEKLVN